MKLWLTSTEIADLALPGMPTTRENVVRRAAEEKWSRYSALCRRRDGRVEFHVSLLPVPARIAYFGGDMPVPEVGDAIQAAPAPMAGTTSAAIAQQDAAIAILAALKTFIRTSELGQTVAIGYFVDLYNNGRIEIPAWAQAIKPRLSRRTVFRWLEDQREGTIHHLAVDRGAGRRGSGVLDVGDDGKLKAYVLALVVQNPLYTARQLHDTLAARYAGGIPYGGELRPLPSQRMLEIALKGWKAELANELLALTNPDAYVSKTRVSGSYAHLIARLNQQWQIDASPVDALCIDGRHSIYACIDIWSRRLILHVSRTPRSEAVQLLMRKAVLAWGVPEQVKTDNGSDFIARASKRLFASLGIEHIQSAPFSPHQKGPVERVIRTFQTDCGRTLPGFIGHSVADRKQIEARKAFAARLGTEDAKAFAVELTGEQLQAEVDLWAAQHYGLRRHGTLGMSPFQRAASSTVKVKTVDPEALAVLLMPAPGGNGLRKVGKKGIRIDGFHYFGVGLQVGRTVFVRMNPDDKGRIWCLDPETDAPICEARCAEVLGENPAALRAETAAAQKKLTDERTAEIKAAKRGITQRTVLDARKQRAAQIAGSVVAFPPRSERHSTPQLAAAADIQARRRGEAPRPMPLTEAAAAIHRELLAEPAAAITQARVTPLRQTETRRQRYRRALDLEARIAAGEAVPTDQAVWLGAYQASHEYRAEKAVSEDLGEAALR